MCLCFLVICIVAGEPTNLIAESNSTHVTVSWKSPGDPVTGYVIYYQSEGGGNSSDIVYGGETESHSLDCLESGVIYNISIVALSLHLPSPQVGPVAVNVPSCNLTLITSTPPISKMTHSNTSINIATTNIETTMSYTTLRANATGIRDTSLITSYHKQPFVSPSKYYVICFR